MSKGNVHWEFYLFDIDGVEKVVEELNAVIDDMVYHSQSPTEAILRYRREFPEIYTRLAEYGIGDSEPQSEICDRITQGLQRKFNMPEYAEEELYEALRWDK